MITAVQEGDNSYKAKIEENFKNIELAIEAVDALPTPALSLVPEWKEIKTEWRALRDGLWERPSEENYRRHTILIDKILLLVRYIGDVSYTINDSDLSIYQLVQILSDHIPALAQYTGMGRAIGTRVILKPLIIPYQIRQQANLLYN